MTQVYRGLRENKTNKALETGGADQSRSTPSGSVIVVQAGQVDEVKS